MMTVQLELQPSKVIFTLWSLLYGGAIICLWLLPFAWWIKVSCTFIGSWYGIETLRQHALLLNKNSIISIRKTTNHWILLQKNGELFVGSFCGSSFVSSHLLVLNFNDANNKKTVTILIMNDSCQYKDNL